MCWYYVKKLRKICFCNGIILHLPKEIVVFDENCKCHTWKKSINKKQEASKTSGGRRPYAGNFKFTVPICVNAYKHTQNSANDSCWFASCQRCMLHSSFKQNLLKPISSIPTRFIHFLIPNHGLWLKFTATWSLLRHSPFLSFSCFFSLQPFWVRVFYAWDGTKNELYSMPTHNQLAHRNKLQLFRG